MCIFLLETEFCNTLTEHSQMFYDLFRLMDMQPLFTIVIACYQTAPYLPKALNSIANQTFSDFEAICYVEDSTDDSLAICQEMASRNSRFKVVSAPKSGAVSSTRNFGITHAKGEYLVVIDGDDWIEDDMLESLVYKLRQTGPIDVLAFAIAVRTNDGNTFEHRIIRSNFRNEDEVDGVFSGMDAIRRASRKHGNATFYAYTWANIYRKAFLIDNKLFQKKGMLMEDYEWTPRVWFLAKRFAYIDKVLYYYRYHGESLTNAHFSKCFLDLAVHFNSFLSFVNGHSIPSDIMAIWSNQWISLLFSFMFSKEAAQKISDSERKRAINQLLIDRDGFFKTVYCASRIKYLTLPLILLSASGWQLPAKFFFRTIYFPLVKWRGSKI